MTASAAGLYDLLLSQHALDTLDTTRSKTRPLHLTEAARLADAVHAQLRGLLEDLSPETSIQDQLRLVNDVLRELRERVTATKGRLIEAIGQPPTVLTSIAIGGVHHNAPETGLSQPWLFTASKGTPSLLTELRKELAAVDRVDILVSFITLSGVRKLRDVLDTVTAVGPDGRARTQIRVLTTTYIGATDANAVHALASLPGCTVRVSLDGRRTRLHAKAWMFHRESGFGSAYVGSANLSGAALAGGLEWTVKITQAAQRDLYLRACAHFDTLWEDPEFERYDPADASHRTSLELALRAESSTGQATLTTFFDVTPHNHQREMLERLEAERAQGRTRNLIVAATGTGKTVTAALDYRAIAQRIGGRPRLLFVSHRREILVQALRTYREVLRDGGFGELLSGTDSPAHFDHLFATIDSVASRALLGRLGADHWHVVVIDECHRMAGARFDAFARAITPAVLLGLTATPERSDGKSLAPYFDMRADGRPAVELRVWHALDLQLLCPFEYYACNDETDFSSVPWRQVGEQQAISNLVSNNDVRARAVLREWQRISGNPRQCHALVFCASLAHARFMTETFAHAGLPVAMVSGEDTPEQRHAAILRLRAGELCALMTVDLFNEGIDIPEVDTLLFLRPTESALLFQQQLGRGLRLMRGKDSCVVLDFVGQHNAQFRYDRLLGSITGLTRRELVAGIEHGFSSLPVGCHVQLQPQVRERVLANLRSQLAHHWRSLQGELRAAVNVRGSVPTLAQFLFEQELSLSDVYRDTRPSGWAELKRTAGFAVGEPGPDESYLSARFGSLLHRDASDQIDALRLMARHALRADAMTDDERRRLQMLAYQLDGKFQGDVESFAENLSVNVACMQELLELADVLDARSPHVHALVGALEWSGLRLHAHYTREEILAAVGYNTGARRIKHREGSLALDEQRTQLLFVTLDKSEGFHAGTSYHDYAISPQLFHWQSQNSTSRHTPIGRRYLESASNGWSIQLFVRGTPKAAYVACGPVEFVSASGDKPIDVVWRLRTSLTAALFERFSALRGV